jgi:hypothetical protein
LTIRTTFADAALGVDVGDHHLQRLGLGGAEEGGRAGDGENRADLDRVLGERLRDEQGGRQKRQ